MKTYVYIDGFNLYYRLIKDTPYKWLDLKSLAVRILASRHSIVKIKYFTANVSELGDPRRPIRQQTYLRAIESYIRELEIFRGHFLTNTKTALVAVPKPPPKQYVTIFDTKEKGSDVNLAVHLVNDAWMDEYECAVIISNDSDLAEAIRLIKKHHPRKLVGVLIPNTFKPSVELRKHADFVRKIRPDVLHLCQLPNPVPGSSIVKPHEW